MIHSAALNGVDDDLLRLFVRVLPRLFDQFAVEPGSIDLHVILYLLQKEILRFLRSHTGYAFQLFQLLRMQFIDLPALFYQLRFLCRVIRLPLLHGIRLTVKSVFLGLDSALLLGDFRSSVLDFTVNFILGLK